ncbi:hypothetical protein BSKO_13683 [Bryopsis sp. KO-2023]|nr:hypothetical protein BSKO_13683 [Bryopsis sp. KO-2023]
MALNAFAFVLLLALPGAFGTYCSPAGSPCSSFGAPCCGKCFQYKCVDPTPAPTVPVFPPRPVCLPGDGFGCSGQPFVPCCNGGSCVNNRCIVGVPVPTPTPLPPVVPIPTPVPPVVPIPTPVPPVVPIPTPAPPVVPTPTPAPPVDFTNCQCKKPASLTLRYIGSGSITVDLTGAGGGSKKKKSKKSKKKSSKKSARRLFPLPAGSSGIITVNSGETFTVLGPFKSSTTVGNAEIHTSCSDALGIGQTFCGTFELVAGTNDQGTSLCPETEQQRKGKCF